LPAFLALAACGPADNVPKYPDVSSFCNGRAKAECNSEVVKACAVVDATHCIDKRQAACVAATPPGMTYSPSGAELCIKSVSTTFADAKLTAEENRSNGESCLRVFDGPGLANATCQSDVECKVSTGLRCVLASGSATGTCQVPQRVQGGGSCTLPSHLCVDDFHCGSSQHCDINSQVGEPCNAVLPCVDAAQCIADLCVSKFNDGTRCTSDDQCIHDLCARGTGAAQGLCVAQMTLAPNEPFCIDAR